MFSISIKKTDYREQMRSDWLRDRKRARKARDKARARRNREQARGHYHTGNTGQIVAASLVGIIMGVALFGALFV